ncbi:MAG: NAD(P)-dependent oxidoreductase [bacterium]|nr:NAD(P)-dependent oxidoreductase [bacterium]
MAADVLTGSRVGVTGHRGFIGRYLVAALQQQGAEVWTPTGDVCLEDTWSGRFDFLFHLAAAMPGRFADEPGAGFAVNVDGTLKALEACKLQGARLILTSTCGIYSPAATGAISESSPVDPQTPYAQSKLMAEMLCRSYATHFGVSSTILRVFNVYGAGQKSEFLIPYLVESALENREAVVYNPASARDFVHVSDAVEALLCAAAQSKPFEIFNIGQGQPHSVQDVLETIEHILDRPILWRRSEGRPDPQPAVYADSTYAASGLGWRPEKSLERGLRDMIEAMDCGRDDR